jgi:hypothetical protein
VPFIVVVVVLHCKSLLHSCSPCSVVLYITCLHMHALQRKIMLALCNLLLLILLAESALVSTHLAPAHFSPCLPATGWQAP